MPKIKQKSEGFAYLLQACANLKQRVPDFQQLILPAFIIGELLSGSLQRQAAITCEILDFTQGLYLLFHVQAVALAVAFGTQIAAKGIGPVAHGRGRFVQHLSNFGNCVVKFCHIGEILVHGLSRRRAHYHEAQVFVGCECAKEEVVGIQFDAVSLNFVMQVCGE